MNKYVNIILLVILFLIKKVQNGAFYHFDSFTLDIPLNELQILNTENKTILLFTKENISYISQIIHNEYSISPQTFLSAVNTNTEIFENGNFLKTVDKTNNIFYFYSNRQITKVNGKNNNNIDIYPISDQTLLNAEYFDYISNEYFIAPVE